MFVDAVYLSVDEVTLTQLNIIFLFNKSYFFIGIFYLDSQNVELCTFLYTEAFVYILGDLDLALSGASHLSRGVWPDMKKASKCPGTT